MLDTASGGWGSDGTDCAVEGLRIPKAREPEARYLGGQRAVGTIGGNKVRRQGGERRRSWYIDGVEEALV